MNNTQLIKQAIDLNRQVTNNTLNAWELVCQQVERLSGTAVSQAGWLPEEGKKTIAEWLDACKKGRESYRNNVDAGFRKLEELFGTGARA